MTDHAEQPQEQREHSCPLCDALAKLHATRTQVMMKDIEIAQLERELDKALGLVEELKCEIQQLEAEGPG